MDRGFLIEERKGYLFIEKQWDKARAKTFLFLTVFATVFLLLLLVLPSYEELPKNFPHIGIYLVVAVICAYLAFAHLRNTTKIRVDDVLIQVRYSPVFFFSKEFTVENIRQLYTKEAVTKRGIVHSVWLSLDNEKSKLLLNGLKTVYDAREIKQAIERYLGIQDEQVEGGYR